MKIQMPENAKFIINKLNQNGYEAYIVGGCVRDAILNKSPSDWDITTSATPYQVKSLFKKTIDTGIQHGTVTVMIDKEGYEVTTYRIDGKYENHRRPKEVKFTASLIEDLKRRDFTINAMAYNDETGLVDCFGGVEDLKNKIIRCVGKAENRFDEDALRILRAIRFAGQLNFLVDEDTQIAMKNKCQNLKDISAERIQVELTKLLTSNNPEKIILAYELGITKVILPEFDKMMETEQHSPEFIYNVGLHCVYTAKYIDNKAIYRWSAILHYVGKSYCEIIYNDGIEQFYKYTDNGHLIARKILKRLKFDNYTIDIIDKLIKYHNYNWGKDIDRKKVRKASSLIGVDIFEDFLKLQKADVLAQSDLFKKEKLEKLDKIEQIYKEILADKECLTMKQLNINGKDLIKLGIEPSMYMGEILKKLFEMVIENPELNDYEVLKNIVETDFKKQNNV